MLPRSLVILCCCAALAHADKPKAEPVVFPVVAGTTFTFTSAQYESTWTTKLAATGALMQFAPHEDTLNYFTKAGFKIAKDGIYIVGETIADLGDPAPAPARAVAFPLKKGGSGTVPGFYVTKYTVGARETVKVPAGQYSAWKITISDKANPSGAVWIAPGVGIVKIRLPSGRVDELAKIAPP